MQKTQDRQNTLAKFITGALVISFIGWGLSTCDVSSPSTTTEHRSTYNKADLETFQYQGQTVVVEKAAVIDEAMTESIVGTLVQIVQANGRRCDSVSSARPQVWDPGYVIGCNDFRYEYSLTDEGGRWVFKVE